MSRSNSITSTSPIHDNLQYDPEIYFQQASIAEARALEKRTRNNIAMQQKKLRAMVGEQYVDLISAADTIIAMSKTAQQVQKTVDHMQSICEVGRIRKHAIQTREAATQASGERKQRPLYVLTSLIKALVDVPEQIWHALENHDYLHATRLYTIASLIHDMLDSETFDTSIDINEAFPVVHRQWDAVSFFKPQIMQKSTAHLGVPEQDAKPIAEILTAQMILKSLTFSDTLTKLLEIRMQNIKNQMTWSTKESKSAEMQEDRVAHQLREVIQIVKATFTHVFDMYISGPHVLVNYVRDSQTNFMKSPSSIARLFSPSTNAYLLVRYLPEPVQNYSPPMDTGDPLTVDEVRLAMQAWLDQVHHLLRDHLNSILQQLTTQKKLVQVRSRVWELLQKDDQPGSGWQQVCQGLLGTHYSIWNTLLRDSINEQAKQLIRAGLHELAQQPKQSVWPLLADGQQPHKGFQLSLPIWPSSRRPNSVITLPNSSNVSEIESFKRMVKQAANERTTAIEQLQSKFDEKLQSLRQDVEYHLAFRDQEVFDCKADTEMISFYFQNECSAALTQYVDGLRLLFKDLDAWADKKSANDVAIVIGRLARTIATLSKELPRAFSCFSSAVRSFELRSDIDKDTRYLQVKNDLLETFHEAHRGWIDSVCGEYASALHIALTTLHWNDECAAALLWERNEADLVFPTQATNDIVRAIFRVCEEMQRVNSNMLDKIVVQSLREKLWQATRKTVSAFLAREPLDLTEKGATQLIFDVYFLSIVLNDDGMTTTENAQITTKAKQAIDPINWAVIENQFATAAERFYLKQLLIMSILTRAQQNTLSSTRKMGAQKPPQQGQHNVLPVAPPVPRFTFLPMGHFNSSVQAQ